MLQIYGASDDQVIIEAAGTPLEQIDCYGEDVEIEVTGEKGGVKITMSLGMTWKVTLQQYPAEDGTPFPGSVEVKTLDQLDEPGYKPDYSPFVEIRGEGLEIETTTKERDD